MTKKNAIKFPQIDREMAIKHLKALGYGEGDTIYLRAFPGKGFEKKGGRKQQIRLSEMPSHFRSQVENKGIYFVVNGGGDDDASVKECRAFFIEHDDLDRELQLDLWKTLGLPEPTIQVDTGRQSIHSYWTLEAPIAPEVWKPLQIDLLAFAGADPSICNPSRVMRLAGCWHIQKDAESVMSTIVGGCGKRYRYDSLRQIVPVKEEPTPSIQNNNTGMKWSEFSAVFRMPCSDRVPLEIGLSAENRTKLIDGVSSYRNESGAALARDLIGTATYFESIGQAYEGDPYQLFIEFCQRCPQDDWKASEWDSIWKSAQKGNATPSCPPDAIEVSVRSWVWKQRKAEIQQQSNPDYTISQSERPKTLKEAVESPLSQENEYASLRLAITGALATFDPLEKELMLRRIASRFSVPMPLVDRIVTDITRRHNTNQTSFSLMDLYNLKQEGSKWIVPRFFPAQGLVCLAGMAKDGKSTLMYDLIRSLVTGDPFLGETPLKKCRVLLIQTEENEAKIRENLEGVGIFDRPELIISNMIQVERDWQIDDLTRLEEFIVKHKPDVIFFDSLRALSRHRGISENAQEFASPVYSLQSFLAQVKIPGLIIHHSNKNKEAIGIERVAGSSSIPGACDDVFQLSRVSDNPESGRRQLVMQGRNCKGRFDIEYIEDEYPYFHFECHGENGFSAAEKKIQERIIESLIANQKASPEGLSASEIKEVMELPKDDRSIYKPLRHLVDCQILTCQRSERDKRIRLYSFPLPPLSSDTYTFDPNSTPQNNTQNPVAQEFEVDRPPTSSFSSAQSVQDKHFGASNTPSTSSYSSPIERESRERVEREGKERYQEGVNQNSENVHPEHFGQRIDNTYRGDSSKPCLVKLWDNQAVNKRLREAEGEGGMPLITDIGGKAVYTGKSNPLLPRRFPSIAPGLNSLFVVGQKVGVKGKGFTGEITRVDGNQFFVDGDAVAAWYYADNLYPVELAPIEPIPGCGSATPTDEFEELGGFKVGDRVVYSFEKFPEDMREQMMKEDKELHIYLGEKATVTKICLDRWGDKACVIAFDNTDLKPLNYCYPDFLTHME